MKVLCVLGKHQYGQPALGEGIEYTAFLPALRRLGHEVIHFESWDRAKYRSYAELNQRLLNCVISESPDVLLAVQRDCEMWTETLDAIRDHGRTATVAWTTDDSWKYREVSRFIGRHYDAITTTYDYVVPWYRQDGIDKVLLTQWAANQQWLHEPLPATECRYGVSFVGKANSWRKKVVTALKHKGIEVECFGEGWTRGPVAAEAIPVIIRESVISLNFADAYKSKARRQLKARTFEVPGAGGLLLTEYAAGLEKYYNLGSEVLACRSIAEMGEQIRRIQNRPDERDAIARAGYFRTRREHTYDIRFAEVLDFARKASERRTSTVPSVSFGDAVTRHQVSFPLARLTDLFVSICAIIWGAEKGRRAARRFVFEISWRLLRGKTFTSTGLPGKLFPEI